MLATRMRNLCALAALLHDQASGLVRDIETDGLTTPEPAGTSICAAAPEAKSAVRALAQALGFMEDAATVLECAAGAEGVPDPYFGTGAPVPNLISFPGVPV